MERLRVLFFSFAADRMNTRTKEYDIDQPVRLAEFFLRELEPFLKEAPRSFLFSVNQEWVDQDTLIGPGDELAVIPPVSGG